MDLDIRTVDAERFDAFHAALAAAFSSGMSPEEFELERKIAQVPRLHRAGLVDEESDGALARADSIFASDPAPWCANMF